MNKLCVFDFDSTLMDGETIDEIAAQVGKKEEIGKITDLAMAGEMDFFDSLTMRASKLQGVKYEDVVKICESLPLMPGAVETVKALKEKGYKVIIFSGGFREATSYHGKILGVDGDFSNRFQHKDGILTGKVGGDMMFGYSKGDMIQRIQQLLNVSIENTIACGDGANDASMFPYAAKKVAFCGKPVLREQANITIDEKDLRGLIEYI
ncbi:MAG: phosphoserine phosphatase SerB [Campylobacterales bacterium]|nr:phosphoserine phosphatase SerB [Campylobacterales bacterium]